MARKVLPARERKQKVAGKKNNSLQEISDILRRAESIFLYPHVHMDGDAIGSCMALSRVLRACGKKTLVVAEEAIPSNLAFLNDGSWTSDAEVGEADISLLVDCGDLERLGRRKPAFLRGKTTVCLDHHVTTEAFCSYNYVDPTAAATGEIVYALFQTAGLDFGPEVAAALYAAIMTDTGRFQYQNTTRRSLEIAACLYDHGLQANAVYTHIYESNRRAKILLEGLAIGKTRFLFDGAFAYTDVTCAMREDTGATLDETERIVTELRSILGVEVAALLKEMDPMECKVSLRSKTNFDVAELALSFGGGGHARAAGFTYKGSLDETEAALKKAVGARLMR